VVDRDQVVGIVSIGDLVKWIITAHEETIGHLQSYIAGNYPASLGVVWPWSPNI